MVQQLEEQKREVIKRGVCCEGVVIKVKTSRFWLHVGGCFVNEIEHNRIRAICALDPSISLRMFVLKYFGSMKLQTA